jgi:RNA polymerase sigma-70 factor (ECF subfamily)
MTAFQELYRRYADDVYRFAYWLSADRSQAEEITAETFARALTSYDSLRAATVKGYLLTIARNVFLEEQRRGKRLVLIDPELAEPRAGPHEQAEGRTELEALTEQLRDFAEVDRTALLLRADGMPYDEIATLLKISLASAKVKVHRLRRKLLEWRMGREKG